MSKQEIVEETLIRKRLSVDGYERNKSKQILELLYKEQKFS